jgi:hypothetical protein
MVETAALVAAQCLVEMAVKVQTQLHLTMRLDKALMELALAAAVVVLKAEQMLRQVAVGLELSSSDMTCRLSLLMSTLELGRLATHLKWSTPAVKSRCQQKIL